MLASFVWHARFRLINKNLPATPLVSFSVSLPSPKGGSEKGDPTKQQIQSHFDLPLGDGDFCPGPQEGNESGANGGPAPLEMAEEPDLALLPDGAGPSGVSTEGPRIPYTWVVRRLAARRRAGDAGRDRRSESPGGGAASPASTRGRDSQGFHRRAPDPAHVASLFKCTHVATVRHTFRRTFRRTFP